MSKSMQQTMDELNELNDALAEVARCKSLIGDSSETHRFGALSVYTERCKGRYIREVFPEDLCKKIQPLVDEYYKEKLTAATQRYRDLAKAVFGTSQEEWW